MVVVAAAAAAVVGGRRRRRRRRRRWCVDDRGHGGGGSSGRRGRRLVVLTVVAVVVIASLLFAELSNDVPLAGTAAQNLIVGTLAHSGLLNASLQCQPRLKSGHSLVEILHAGRSESYLAVCKKLAHSIKTQHQNLRDGWDGGSMLR